MGEEGLDDHCKTSKEDQAGAVEDAGYDPVENTEGVLDGTAEG